VKSTDNQARVILISKKVSYQAEILPGRQLPGQPKSKAGARQGAKAVAGGGARRGTKASGPPPPATIIRKMDQDGDQRVLRQEFLGPGQKFSKIDANQDGYLTLDEFMAARKRGAAKPKLPNGQAGGPSKGGAPNPKMIVQKMDKNGDGKLSKTEFRGPKKKFAKLDADKDGFVTKAELASIMAKRPAGGGNPGGPSGSGQQKKPSMSERFAQMDSNGDGNVEESEWRGPKSRFKRMDRNRDGKLSSDEIEKVVKRANQAPLRNLAMKAYNVPESRLETRTGRTDCVFDNKEYSFKHFDNSRYPPNCALGGSILFVDNFDKKWPMIYEISPTGELIWEYSVTANVPLGTSDMRTHAVMDPSLLPNGNILYLIKHYGIFEVNRAGKTVWNYLDSGISHDFDRLANGNTLFVRGWVSQGEDHIREVTPSGKRVWSWNGVDQFKEPEFQPQLEALKELDRKNAASTEMSLPGYEGWFHANAVTRAPDGTTMLSIRNFHRVVFIKHAGDITKYIPIGFTHDPELLANGNILVNIPVDGVAEFSGSTVIWRWGGKNWEEKRDGKKTIYGSRAMPIYCRMEIFLSLAANE
jgi:Ca2+-binding EF-hand superfamily protein